jgi:hypothetical protein
MRAIIMLLVVCCSIQMAHARGSEHCYNGFNQEVDCGMPPPPDLNELSQTSASIADSTGAPQIELFPQSRQLLHESKAKHLCVISKKLVCTLPDGPVGVDCHCNGMKGTGLSY